MNSEKIDAAVDWVEDFPVVSVEDALVEDDHLKVESLNWSERLAKHERLLAVEAATGLPARRVAARGVEFND